MHVTQMILLYFSPRKDRVINVLVVTMLRVRSYGMYGCHENLSFKMNRMDKGYILCINIYMDQQSFFIPFFVCLLVILLRCIYSNSNFNRCWCIYIMDKYKELVFCRSIIDVDISVILGFWYLKFYLDG